MIYICICDGHIQGSEEEVFYHEKNDASSHIDKVRTFAQDMDTKNSSMLRELQVTIILDIDALISV